MAWLVWFYINLKTISYRKGVEFADYLPVKLAFDSAKKQVYIKPENDLLWIEVCSDEDPQCQRSNTQGLNPLENVASTSKQLHVFQ